VIGEGGGVDPRRLLPALAVVACACVVATIVGQFLRSEPDPAAPAAAPASAPVTDEAAGPAGVLAAWDARRARAWAAGDPSALRHLYAAGSRAGAADVGLLRRYIARGLTVRGLRTQVLALEVVARTDSRLELVVTDRTVGGRAVGAHGRSVALPAGHASRRRVVLVRRRARWLVREVREHPPPDQPSAAASTSRTSSSSKS
jgi:hypothetical protein